jgi:hypothetical protein
VSAAANEDELVSLIGATARSRRALTTNDVLTRRNLSQLACEFAQNDHHCDASMFFELFGSFSCSIGVSALLVALWVV